ncbi:MAG: NAD-dependent epimerase/dehydratase family protein [Mesorhizobium sp.]|jgi:nucleoside-diphosphate-sugar epimerase|nr:NAD-dependent epimerase/dehydratase family protein [Mesorhizobium sp.]MBL8579197.1 NAD-dependent epimerase/dehydratase family protein [Mesorhizobium sp.]
MKILVTGATGYIGGSVAHRLVSEGHAVRGLVRSPEKAGVLASRGITPVIGDLDKSDLLAEEAAQADAIVNAASTLHFEAAQALVTGARAGTRIVHTSGIGAYSNDEHGQLGDHPVLDDTSLPPVGPHLMQQKVREVENVFLGAASAGKHGIVLSNPLIYGVGLGMARHSVQIPMMARAAAEAGYVAILEPGTNVWSTAHIEDVVDLYILALAKAPAGSFYFVENGSSSFADIGKALAAKLDLGEPRFLPLGATAAIYGEMAARYLLGTSSRVRAKRAREDLGWSPKYRSAEDWIASDADF